MSNAQRDCVVCGDPLPPPGSDPRSRCARCSASHLAGQLADPKEAARALDAAQKNLRMITGDLDFLESDQVLTRKDDWFPILGILALIVVGGVLLWTGLRKPPFPAGGIGAETPSSLPGVSWEEQNRTVYRIMGIVLLFAGGCGVFMLPWARWASCRRALANARVERKLAQDLVRRITERLPRDPHVSTG